MPRTFIDMTDDESHNNGHIPVSMVARDNLSGCNMGLIIGEVELVVSVSQAITLFDVLDGWLNGGPAQTIGGIERRILDAVKETVRDDPEAVKAAKTQPDRLTRQLYENMKMFGVRFRLTGEEGTLADYSNVEDVRRRRFVVAAATDA